MPSISHFYGLVIWLYWNEDKSQHHLPHIHAEYGDYEAVYDFDGKMIEGSMPLNKKKLVVAWIAIHVDELQANWTLLDRGEQFFKIDPLK